jgi:hypothetical protein
MSLIVTRSNGTSDITFALQQQVGTQKTYVNAAAGLVEPEQITMQAFLRPVGAKGSDRYTIKASKIFVEDATGNHITTSAKIELVIPRSAESGLATAFADQVAFVKSVLSGTNLTALIAGSLPDGDNHVDTFNPA